MKQKSRNIRLFSNVMLAAVGCLIVLGSDTVKKANADFSPGSYYYGVFEDGQLQTDDQVFTNTINDLKNHDLNAILFTNTQPNLSISDALNFNVVAAPMKELYASWYPTSVPLDIDLARTLMYPIVDALKTHPSLIGYNIRDDSTPDLNDKMRMVKQIFAERDPVNPTTPLLIEGSLAQEVYSYVQPATFMSYEFPFKADTSACQVFRGSKDWVYDLRESFQIKPSSDPNWMVLQAHKTLQGAPSPGDSSDLRQPSPEEISLQHWEALGEEAKGIFWYTYSTSPFQQAGQYWIGLKDLPDQFNMVKSLAASLWTLEPYLMQSEKIPDRFSVSGDNYVSTFKDKTQDTYYVIAVNQSCSPQNLALSSDYFGGSLKDLITGQVYPLDSNIAFSGGGGKMFQLIAPTSKTPPPMQSNLVQNPSFESVSSGKPDAWLSTDQIASDSTTAHSGNTSVKIGPSGSSAYQNINLTPNTYYYFSYWIKAQNLDKNVVGMRVIQTTPSVVYLTTPNWHQSGSFNWVKRVGFFRTPADTDKSRIEIVWDLNPGATFWIDDVTLCQMNQPCPDEYLAERLNGASPSASSNAAPNSTLLEEIDTQLQHANPLLGAYFGFLMLFGVFRGIRYFLRVAV